jgi:hypothetical protein
MDYDLFMRPRLELRAGSGPRSSLRARKLRGVEFRMHQIVREETGRARDSRDVVNPDVPLAGFALAQIGLADAGLFGEVALAKSGVFARGLDVVADELPDTGLGFIDTARHLDLSHMPQLVASARSARGGAERCIPSYRPPNDS